MKRRRLYIITAFVIMLLTSVIGGGYAYWASSTNAPSDPKDADFDITVGTGKSIDTFIAITPDNTDKGILVPAKRVEEDTDQVAEITYTIAVHWKEENDGDYGSGFLGNLVTSFGDVTLQKGEEDPYSDLYNLVNVVIKVNDEVITNLAKTPIKLNAEEGIEIKVIFTMNEPDSVTEYNTIAGVSIGFKLTFNVEVE